ALRILKQDGRKIGLSTDFSMIDEEDKRKIIRRILKQKGLDEKLLEKTLSYLSLKREKLQDSGDLEEIYIEYLKALKSSDLLDFSELLYQFYNLLKAHGNQWKSFFKFVLVDEFQDTNTVQYEIIRLLAKENVCVVGDPNQCIYEWRHAKPDNILRFMEDFKPDVIKLEYNYRSNKNIIALANAILTHSHAPWKHLVPVLKTVRDGNKKPVVRRFENEMDESAWIAQEIKKLLGLFPSSDIALLVRAGYITDAIERALFQAKVPYKVVGAVRFFERSEIKDVLGFLKILVNPRDEISFLRCLECVGLSRIFELIKEFYKGNWLDTSKEALGHLSKKGSEGMYKLLQSLAKLSKNSERYSLALKEFLEEIDYQNYMQQRYGKDHEERKENLREFINFLEEKEKEGYTLMDVLEEINLMGGEEDSSDSVKVMTIHASKGLEFSAVFLPRLEDGILPHEKAMGNISQIEEERRLFYVAVTRAKELLYMTYTRSKGRKPSRFLSEIPKEHLDLSAYRIKRTSYKEEFGVLHSFSVGDKVKHMIFGTGRIVSIDGEKAVVDFDGRVKSIHKAFLELIT
ncbi:MAG: ATP-dependent helicase, partial [Aquificaceae bacterium]